MALKPFIYNQIYKNCGRDMLYILWFSRYKRCEISPKLSRHRISDTDHGFFHVTISYTHIHIIKNFLPNPFSDPSVARSLCSLWLSYVPNRGVRRIFKRGGLRGYCGRGSGAQPPENFNWIIC